MKKKEKIEEVNQYHYNAAKKWKIQTFLWKCYDMLLKNKDYGHLKNDFLGGKHLAKCKICFIFHSQS